MPTPRPPIFSDRHSGYRRALNAPPDGGMSLGSGAKIWEQGVMATDVSGIDGEDSLGLRTHMWNGET